MGDVLLEDGGKTLLEDGTSAAVLEGDGTAAGGGVLLESGDGVLLEDGSGRLDLEAGGSGPQAFRQALVARLGSIAGLTAIVGDSIYPGALPETHDLGRDGPALTYTIAASPRGHVLSGADGTATARVQLDAWSYALASADAATLAVWNAIDGPPGTWGDGSVAIMSVSHQDEQDDHQPPKAGTDQWTYRITSDYAVKFRTGFPTLT